MEEGSGTSNLGELIGRLHQSFLKWNHGPGITADLGIPRFYKDANYAERQRTKEYHGWVSEFREDVMLTADLSDEDFGRLVLLMKYRDWETDRKSVV